MRNRFAAVALAHPLRARSHGHSGQSGHSGQGSHVSGQAGPETRHWSFKTGLQGFEQTTVLEELFFAWLVFPKEYASPLPPRRVARATDQKTTDFLIERVSARAGSKGAGRSPGQGTFKTRPRSLLLSD